MGSSIRKVESVSVEGKEQYGGATSPSGRSHKPLYGMPTTTCFEVKPIVLTNPKDGRFALMSDQLAPESMEWYKGPDVPPAYISLFLTASDFTVLLLIFVHVSPSPGLL